MPLSKLFWFLAIVNLILLGLLIIGYDVLEIIISLFIISLVLIEVNRELGTRKMGNKLKDEILGKIGDVEKICNDIIYHFKSNPSYNISVIETKLQKHKEDLKDEFNDNLDKMAKKVIQIENKLHEMGKTLGAAVAMFDERMNIIEQPNEEESDEDNYAELMEGSYSQ